MPNVLDAVNDCANKKEQESINKARAQRCLEFYQLHAAPIISAVWDTIRDEVCPMSVTGSYFSYHCDKDRGTSPVQNVIGFEPVGFPRFRFGTVYLPGLNHLKLTAYNHSWNESEYPRGISALMQLSWPDFEDEVFRDVLVSAWAHVTKTVLAEIPREDRKNFWVGFCNKELFDHDMFEVVKWNEDTTICLKATN
jgi:hypothetical protein